MINSNYFIFRQERLSAKRAELEMITDYAVKTSERLLSESEELLRSAENALEIGKEEFKKVFSNYQNK